LEYGPPASGDGGRMSPNSGAGSIHVAGCSQILVPPGFRQPTIAGFRQLNIKCVCKDEEFNFKKRKTVNRFQKIKEGFTVKPKIIFVDHYFLSYQIP
jgi:hypothetical protein